MKIRVLGASGSDIPGHHLSSFLLNNKILFDAGGVTSSLSFTAQQKIEHIFITHAHLDHIRDIPFLADNIILSGKSKRINIYSIKEVIDDIKKHLLNYRLWPDFTVIPDVKNSILDLKIIHEEKSILLDGYKITAYRMNHTVPAVGFLVEKEGRSFFYTGDTGPAINTWKKFLNKKLNALIIEVSLPDKMKDLATKTGHLTPRLLFEDLKLFNQKPEKIFITHIKPLYKKAIERELKKYSDYKIEILQGRESIKI
ncbi:MULTISPECIES: 3',5'-cyclic-nucleotide phosphodiesterase [Thermodesulfovibrio]|uniref:cAMP phosphodiesterases class-II:metallo-beta-lactamase superfamily n=1 Tax=Thermodesulfovibrio yellowstonii (strain ATCC 51303 / DSM 11347 / YP87) TaxID=289376 RepID=B5YIS2_THEYD|nr:MULTISPECIES: 3',5'-cyclic-nucleotide phosphodiesterase [Thermodesulfovibrio]ACI21597.1 cAMP phosphodiesterases class-II:metallo-beta-lactamase superfamily [Thermodesulfovibrio yellowstonii DSM 11347]MDI6864482.1 3',5'-cyclic-nucleotide phosphodiesterase [Thermodesulfovibrio yellowstonii]